jgi:hypothetical protein
MLTPSLNLFLVALIVGLGFGLGWSFITWLFGELVALGRRSPPP